MGNGVRITVYVFLHAGFENYGQVVIKTGTGSHCIPQAGVNNVCRTLYLFVRVNGSHNLLPRFSLAKWEGSIQVSQVQLTPTKDIMHIRKHEICIQDQHFADR